ncbi:MAG: hypothetical protein GY730_02925 [bacterium]|nr:hypothetical protein [bacterium]MCP4108397.1 hypothetical protein [Desulfobacteraceae bacterium]
MSDNKRNLVILFDGTWNDADEKIDDATNVEKIYRLLPNSYINNIHYEEGVGTRSQESISGLIWGSGIDDRILGSYRFLQSKFDGVDLRNDQSKIYIFGFSRGAYTARTFAQLLYYCGVPQKDGNPNKAWDAYYRQDLKLAEKLRDGGNFFDINIEMLGVWDTVKSTLDDDRNDMLLYPNVKYAYHAMAIDEKRKLFPILRFRKDPRISEVWFAGVHSDIGGGYKRKESQLSDITLLWMVKAAEKHGLAFVSDYLDYLAPSPLGTMHNSLQGVWKELGTQNRTILSKDILHVSVEERLLASIRYEPTNIPNEPLFSI